MGKLLTFLPRLACTTAADAPVNYSVVFYSVYVLQRPEMFTSPRWESADVLAPTLARTTAARSHNCG
jgi:hypothetical protein